MSEDNQKMRIVIAPHVIEQLEQEMTPDELQEFFDDIQKMAEDGTFLEHATPIDMDELRTSEPDVYAQLMSHIDQEDNTPTLH